MKTKFIFEEKIISLTYLRKYNGKIIYNNSEKIMINNIFMLNAKSVCLI